MKRNHLGGLSGRHQWGEASPGEPPGHTKCGLVEGTHNLIYLGRLFASSCGLLRLRKRTLVEPSLSCLILATNPTARFVIRITAHAHP